jgi:hypothetical protein
MLALLACSELVAGVKIWVEVLNGGHLQTLERCRLLSYLTCTLVYIAYVGIE